jgi:hypothetical protein
MKLILNTSRISLMEAGGKWITRLLLTDIIYEGDGMDGKKCFSGFIGYGNFAWL